MTSLGSLASNLMIIKLFNYLSSPSPTSLPRRNNARQKDLLSILNIFNEKVSALYTSSHYNMLT